jgi:programmed cell death protein 5
MDDDDSGQQGDSDVREAYRKKAEDYQKRQQAEAQLKAIVNKLFEPAAIGRLNNIRLSNPELYLQVVQLFLSLHQQGRIGEKVTEEQLKQLVARILSQRRETTIRRL